MKRDIAILGGGVAALGAAYNLAKNNISPTIIERGIEFGGLASSYKIGGFCIERFYHHFFPTDTLVFELAKELGIQEKIVWRKTKMGFYYKDKLYPFTTPIDLLRFEPLLLKNRIRFGLGMLRIATKNDFGNLDNKNAREWLIETFGDEVYEKIFRPMLGIKFAMSLNDASAAFVHGRLAARASSRSKNLSSEKLGYMEGGYDLLVGKMYDFIKDGSEIFLNSQILQVEYRKNYCKIKIERGKKFEIIQAREVINTLPLEIFARIAKNFPKKIMGAIGNVKYQAIICAVIGIKKKLSDYYWINISSSNLPFHGVIEHTNFMPSSNYENNHIAYIFNYVTCEHEFWKMEDEEIKGVYLEGLMKMFPQIKKSDILWFRLSKERYATPIFLKGYENNMKKIESLGNVHFAGSFRIYPNSRNVNNVIKTGIDAAREVIYNKT